MPCCLKQDRKLPARHDRMTSHTKNREYAVLSGKVEMVYRQPKLFNSIYTFLNRPFL